MRVIGAGDGSLVNTKSQPTIFCSEAEQNFMMKFFPEADDQPVFYASTAGVEIFPETSMIIVTPQSCLTEEEYEGLRKITDFAVRNRIELFVLEWEPTAYREQDLYQYIHKAAGKPAPVLMKLLFGNITIDEDGFQGCIDEIPVTDEMRTIYELNGKPLPKKFIFVMFILVIAFFLFLAWLTDGFPPSP